MSIKQLRLEVRLTLEESGSGDLGTPRKSHLWSYEQVFSEGSGEFAVNKGMSDTRSLSAAAESFDTAGWNDAFGAVTNPSKLKLILVANNSEVSGEKLEVGGAALNALADLFSDVTDELRVGPGGFALLVNPIDGYTVTPGTGDLLKVDPGAASVSYDLVLAGH